MDIKEVYLIADGMAYLQKEYEERPDMTDTEVLDLLERMENLRYCLMRVADRRK